VETIAVYWEAKPKTYGFREVFGLSLMNIEIKPEEMSRWGLWLMELADFDIGFHLILAKYSTHQKLRLYILLEKFVADSVLSYIDKRIDPESKKKIHLTSPVELISFQVVFFRIIIILGTGKEIGFSKSHVHQGSRNHICLVVILKSLV